MIRNERLRSLIEKRRVAFFSLKKEDVHSHFFTYQVGDLSTKKVELVTRFRKTKYKIEVFHDREIFEDFMVSRLDLSAEDKNEAFLFCMNLRFQEADPIDRIEKLILKNRKELRSGKAGIKIRGEVRRGEEKSRQEAIASFKSSIGGMAASGFSATDIASLLTGFIMEEVHDS